MNLDKNKSYTKVLLAMYIDELDRKENNDIFNGYGSVKRCHSLPEWLKKATYFKCNGMCQRSDK